MTWNVISTIENYDKIWGNIRRHCWYIPTTKKHSCHFSFIFKVCLLSKQMSLVPKLSYPTVQLLSDCAQCSICAHVFPLTTIHIHKFCFSFHLPSKHWEDSVIIRMSNFRIWLCDLFSFSPMLLLILVEFCICTHNLFFILIFHMTQKALCTFPLVS